MINKVAVLCEKDCMYHIGGRAYARISAIANAGPKPYLEQWKKRVGDIEAERISRETAEYGDLVHEITMWDDLKAKRKVQIWLRKHPFLADSLFAWRRWVSLYIKEWLMIEKIVWSDSLMCAGKIDRVGIIIGDKKPSIIDLKTGGIWDTIGVQLAGYLVAYNEKAKKKAHRRLAISLPRKDPGKLVVKEFTENKFIEEFRSKAELFKSMSH